MSKLKLEDLTSELIEVVKRCGPNGIMNTELAEKLNAPMRRVYDVVITLRAAGLIKAIREKHGTRIFWNEDFFKEMGMSVSDKHIPSTERGGPSTAPSRIIKKSPNEITIEGTTVRITPSGVIEYVANSGTELIVRSSGKRMKIEAVDV